MHFAWRILWGSLRHQRARLSIAALAMALGSALVSGLLNLSGDIRGQVGRELRAYGANLIIRPREQSLSVGSGRFEFGTVAVAQTMPQVDLEAARQVKGVIGVVPYLYTVVEAERRPVIMAGVDLTAARSLHTWWQVQGRWPAEQVFDEILVGARAARVLGVAPGDTLDISSGDRRQTMRVVGIVETGGAEDEQLVTGLSGAQALTDQPGQVGLALVSALAADRPLGAVARALQTRLPNADVRALSQFASTEARIVNKVRWLIGLVAALVLIAGALTVAGTLNTIVMERRTEIGLMKALGAADRRVAGLFVAEALSVGVVGGGIGYLAGLALAVAIGRRVFEANIALTPVSLPGTLLIALGVALFASWLPVRRALAVDPVITLRGE